MKALLKDHITRHLVTIDKNATAEDAYKLMTNNWVRHLPVLDSENDLIVGMLSDRDLMRAPTNKKPVYELMSSPVRTFEITTPVKKVVQTMIEDKLSAFLITRNEDVVGIVTTEDMLLLLAQFLTEEESSKWILGEFLVNPALQSGVNMVSQAGI